MLNCFKIKALFTLTLITILVACSNAPANKAKDSSPEKVLAESSHELQLEPLNNNGEQSTANVDLQSSIAEKLEIEISENPPEFYKITDRPAVPPGVVDYFESVEAVGTLDNSDLNADAYFYHNVQQLLDDATAIHSVSLYGQGVSVGVWDAGSAFRDHVEFGTRLNLSNSTAPLDAHATHVAGTIGASGANKEAKGMAKLSSISSYDWNDDIAELTSSASTGMTISNHSYGQRQGWDINFQQYKDDAGRSSCLISSKWIGHGADGDLFAGYSQDSSSLDNFVRNHPHRSVFWAAGNDRTQTSFGKFDSLKERVQGESLPRIHLGNIWRSEQGKYCYFNDKSIEQVNINMCLDYEKTCRNQCNDDICFKKCFVDSQRNNTDQCFQGCAPGDTRCQKTCLADNLCRLKRDRSAATKLSQMTDSRRGYNTVGAASAAKNVIAIGAMADPDFDRTTTSRKIVPGEVVTTNFSNWGPTDDGRIKPDVIANGAYLESPIPPCSCHRWARNSGEMCHGIPKPKKNTCQTNDNFPTEERNRYHSESGTSMASPVAAGIGALLNQLAMKSPRPACSQHPMKNRVVGYPPEQNSCPLFADEMKAALIHSAMTQRIGSGPSFKTGWGMIDAPEAGKLINAVNGNSLHRINLTPSGQELNLKKSGTETGKITAVWIDKESSQPSANLIHDIDLRLVTPNGTTIFPWRLDKEKPSNSACRGNNNIDNVEQVEVPVDIAQMSLCEGDISPPLISVANDNSLWLLKIHGSQLTENQHVALAISGFCILNHEGAGKCD